MTAGTNGVLSLEQKMKILIQPKKTKAGALRIAYSVKRKEKNTSHIGKTSTTFTEIDRRST